MTEEQEYERLKAATIKQYASYIAEIEETSISDLGDYKKRRRLVELFALTVEANAAYRKFILQYPISRQGKTEGE